MTIVPEAVRNYAIALPLGSHAVFFYDTAEVASQVFAAYLKGGIQHEEATYFISRSREEYEDLFKPANIDITSLEKKGYLTHIQTLDYYFEGERFSLRKVSESMQNVVNKTIDSGFKGARTIGLMISLMEYNVPPKELMAFERSLGKALSPQISAICSYNGRKLLDTVEGHESFIELVKTHGHNIFQGVAFPNLREQQSNKRSDST